jgi:hypothetical protein
LKPDAPQAARNLANRLDQYNPTAPWTVKWLRNYHQYNQDGETNDTHTQPHGP